MIRVRSVVDEKLAKIRDTTIENGRKENKECEWIPLTILSFLFLEECVWCNTLYVCACRCVTLLSFSLSLVFFYIRIITYSSLFLPLSLSFCLIWLHQKIIALLNMLPTTFTFFRVSKGVRLHLKCSINCLKTWISYEVMRQGVGRVCFYNWNPFHLSDVSHKSLLEDFRSKFHHLVV